MSPPRPPPKSIEAGTEIGTLVVVVDRARNLVDKQRIGKQSPYVTVNIPNSPVSTKRTQTINRGGQAPEWDAELRFPILSDAEDSMRSDGKIAPGKSMTLICWADDSREPSKVGEAFVDLTKSLTKGEDDIWVPLSLDSKDGGKYRGEVRLELTFFSNASPPPKQYKPPTVVQATPTKPPQKKLGQPRLSAPVGSSNTGRQSISNMPLYRPEYMENSDRIPSPQPHSMGLPPRNPSPQPIAIPYQQQLPPRNPSPQPTPGMGYQIPVNNNYSPQTMALNYQTPATHSTSPQPPVGYQDSSQPSMNAVSYQPLPSQVPTQALSNQPLQTQPDVMNPSYQQGPSQSLSNQQLPSQLPSQQDVGGINGYQIPQQQPTPPQIANGYQQNNFMQPNTGVYGSLPSTSPNPSPGQSPIPQPIQQLQQQQPTSVPPPVPPRASPNVQATQSSQQYPSQLQTQPNNGAWSPWQTPEYMQPQQTPMMYQQYTPTPLPQPPTQSRPLPSAPVIQSPFPTYPPPQPTSTVPPPPQQPSTNVYGQPPQPQPQPLQMYPNYPPPPIPNLNGFSNMAQYTFNQPQPIQHQTNQHFS